MVLNVLDNAAKWSPPRATVHTTLHVEDTEWAVLTITDTGPGIGPEDLPHVFDRFYRATAARGTPAPVSASPSSPRPPHSMAAPPPPAQTSPTASP